MKIQSIFLSLVFVFAANAVRAVDASASDAYLSFSGQPTAVSLTVRGSNGSYYSGMFGGAGSVSEVEDVTHVTSIEMLAEDGGAIGNACVQVTLTVPAGATATVGYETYKYPTSNQVYVQIGSTTITDIASGRITLYPGTYDLEVDCVSNGGTAVADMGVTINY